MALVLGVAWSMLPCPGAATAPPLTTNELDPPLTVAPAQPLASPPVAPSQLTQPPPATVVTNRDPLPQRPTGELFPLWPTNTLLETQVPLRDWADYYALPAPRRIGEFPQPTYEVRAGGGRALLRIGSPRATIRGVDVLLTHVPQLLGGQPVLHRLDLQKSLHPLLWVDDAAPLLTTNRIIVIDAGHGGKDVGTGTGDGRHFEKTYTLDWALRLRPLLERQGLQVVMTRTNDVEVPLAHRVFIAEEAGAALFISLHFNSAQPVPSRKGLETYALTPPGMPSTFVRDGEDNPRLAFPNNAHDRENLQLAWRIHRAVLNTTHATDRGVQRARFLGVLRGQGRPAVLVEGGYLSNPEESRRIADPQYRQRLAEGVADAVRELVRAPLVRASAATPPEGPAKKTSPPAQ
ncbi:MAG TPA: hypothetical protein DCM86_18485 [Verrucomicrobiales bacterium]|nr:hypothetical protein [Verrucomicrobiales bacterium]